MPDETPVTDAPAEVAPPVEAPATVAPEAPPVEAVASAAPDPAPAPVTVGRRRVVPLPAQPVDAPPAAADDARGPLRVSAWGEGTDAALTEPRATAALVAVEAAEVLPPYVIVDGARCPIVVDPRGPGCVAVIVNVNGADAVRTAESLRVALAMLGREFGEVVA